jgi:hypothetical protein
MHSNRTPLGKPLELPADAPLRVNAVFDSGAPCLDHQVAYTGSVPCTGVLRCSLCLCRWDVTGRYLGRETSAE